MSSEPPTDLYRRYKIGTNHVVNWLSTTAAVTVPRPESLAITHGRKHKKHKSKTRPGPTTSSAAEATKLTSHDLLELSHALAASANGMTPPPRGITDAILVLEDVISGRKECATWYAQRIDREEPSSKRSDASHSAFVRVLSQVLAQLKTVLQKSKTMPLPARGTGNTKRDLVLANIYQALHVDEEEHALDENHTQPDKSGVVFELEVDEGEEKAFALWCFLRDCYQIRQHVKAVWARQQARGVPAMVASQISTCAILLISPHATSFATKYPDLGTFDKIAEFLDIKATLSGLNVVDFSCNKEGLGAFHISVADLVCLPATTGLSVLRHHREVLDAGHSTQKSFAYLAAAHPLFRTIAEAMPEFQALQADKKRLAALYYGDAFTQLLIDICTSDTTSQSSSEIELLVGLAFQMQLEIHDLLGPNTQCEYILSSVAVGDFLQTIQNYQAHVNQLGHTSKLGATFTKSPSRKSLRRRILTNLSPPTDSKVAKSWMALDSPSGTSLISPLEPYMPSLCGHITWSMLQARHMDAMETISLDLALTAMVHLYQACRTVGSLDLAWDDLDFVIARRGPDAFGLGKLLNHERSALYSARNFAVAMGVSYRELSRLRKTRSPPTISLAVGLQQTPNALSPTKFLDTLRPLLQGRGRLKGKPSAARAVLHQAAHEVMSSPDIAIDRDIQDDWLASNMLSATQVLKVLEVGMTSEELNMQFDRHQLMTQIYSIFDQLPDLMASFPVPHRSETTAARAGRMPHEFVNDVLWEAAASQSNHRPLNGLDMISGILVSHIRHIGTTNLNHATYILKGGFLPNNMRPSALPGAREEDAQLYRKRQMGLTTTLQGAKLDLATPNMTHEDTLLYAKARTMRKTDPEGAEMLLDAHLQKKWEGSIDVRLAYQQMCRERLANARVNEVEERSRTKAIHKIMWTKKDEPSHEHFDFPRST